MADLYKTLATISTWVGIGFLGWLGVTHTDNGTIIIIIMASVGGLTTSNIWKRNKKKDNNYGN